MSQNGVFELEIKTSHGETGRVLSRMEGRPDQETRWDGKDIRAEGDEGSRVDGAHD